MISIKSTKTAEELEQCLEIRKIVFIEGQNVPYELEIDGLDAAAYHLLALQNNTPIGTARALLLEEDTVAKIGRVAVLESGRGLGIGHMIMQEMEKDSRLASAICFKLEAQTYALPFYEKLGYEAYGKEFDDAGIPHMRMKKKRRD